ncbi:Radial spoke protein 3 [Aureococcus anophagefferens]|nr:Radial spoke protein 3 [Aureococcus anophagefferens]
MEGSAYIHSTSPKPVSSKMKKAYRDEDEENLAGNNIMFDRRVVRGNTYAAQVVTQNAQRETETFLELADRPVEAEATTQTEAFVDRPPQVLFVPSKTGVDKETEIPGGDLFDFDVEVKPILEVLVGKTLRISMLEVMEEEELEAIRRRQREFEQMRNAELMEVQRLDAEASRKFAEKQRRVAQEKERLRMQAELETKVAARSFARNYLVDLSDAVFDALETTGHFYDPCSRRSRTSSSWLLDGVVADADNHGAARARRFVADAMELAVATQAAVLADIKAKEEARLAAIAEAERLAAEEAARLEAEAAPRPRPRRLTRPRE